MNYKMLMDSVVDNIIASECEYLYCSNVLCDDHDEQIMKLLDYVAQQMNRCAWLTIPRKKLGQSTAHPGWNDFVKEHREKSIFWHDVWKNAGRPATGQLADLRRSTRRKYHWAIKQSKKSEDQIIKDKIANCLINKSFKHFWITIKSLKREALATACVVDGVHGDMNIAVKFKEIYEHLYNSVEDNEINMIRENICDRVSNVCAEGRCRSLSCHNIDIDLVKAAVRELNSNKSGESYELNSNHVINASESLFVILSMVFNSMLLHGCCNVKFYKSVIKPIPKNKKK